jgi:hypothetical protein
MFRVLAILILLVFSACSGGESNTQQGSEADEAAGGGAGSPPDAQMVNCLNRFREKKYEEALAVCRQALASNPGDPQILKAIELSEQALKQDGGA